MGTGNNPAELTPHHARMMAIAAKEYGHSSAICSTLNRAAETIDALQAQLNDPAHAAKVLLDLLATPTERAPITQEIIDDAWKQTFREPGFVAVSGFLTAIAIANDTPQETDT